MEINKKELRLGNLFFDRKGQICKVERIEKEFEECKIVSDTGLTHLPVKPIQLTEEVLLRCGAVKGYYNWFRLYLDSDKSQCLTYNINSKMLCLESFYDGEKESIQIKKLNERYLHQLQNLYFALTGEELTYNHS